MLQRTYLVVAVVLAVMAVFAFSPERASACTGIVLEGQDGTFIYGRTQEWGTFDFETQATVYPRGKSFQATTPDGEKGISWEAKHGFLGFLLVNSVVGDGMNEKGLAAGSFYHEGFAEYTEYDPAKAKESLAPTDVVRYILSNFATVEEVREGMKKVRVVPVENETIETVPPVHFFIADPSGKSLVMEFLEGKMVLYDNPVGVITNNPTFDWHLQNLRNYGYLQIEPFETKKWGDLEITPLSPGSGLLGLPGDYTSPSRFVRALVLKEISLPTKGGLDTVNQFFRIMDSFNVPSSQGEGTSEAETEAEKQEHLPSVTQWTVAHDTTDRITYYHTAWNRQIRKIDLKKIDFTKSEVRKRPIDQEQVQSVKDVTADLQ